MLLKATNQSAKISSFTLCLAIFSSPVISGSLDSPAAVADANSAMYTVNDIYNRLDTGEAGAKRGTTFIEPVSGPASTGKDLNEVMTISPAIDDSNGATTAEVSTGTTFWGLTSGQWGVQTGTLVTAALPISSAIPKTGQTTCYDTSSTITCGDAGFPGQDGDYQLGTNTMLTPTIGINGAYLVPPWTGSRFTDNGNGTVRDNLTELIWLKNANCFGVRFWAQTQALTDAATLNSGECDLSDGSIEGEWRLPNINELHSLVDLSQSNPALPEGHPFISVQLSSPYSSSSTSADFPDSVWSVHMTNGYVQVYNKIVIPQYVWPVRGGQ